MENIDTHLEIVREELPSDVADLGLEAQAEGYRLIDTLMREWADGTNRYDGTEEILMTVRRNDRLVGIGGVTVDPVVTSALRMRRFYIGKAFRRHGLGRRLASALIESVVPQGKPIFVNAGTKVAPAFWEAIGFRRHVEAGHTHVLGDFARMPDADQL
ncbi:MAG: GNAT family N-acetyltransferase [Rhizobiaceae bacterium]|nr:GNAT family N-acetyltransferase [Rhizobiaceae bacterium]